MKIIINDSDNFILFFNKLNDISFNNDEDFKSVFLKLKQNYNIDIYGFYNINVLIDNNYGYILKVIKEDELFYKQIDMNIIVKKCNFLYKVNDYFFINDLDKFNIYFYNDYFYLEIINEISDKEYNYLIENSEIIYENIDKITKKNYK